MTLRDRALAWWCRLTGTVPAVVAPVGGAAPVLRTSVPLAVDDVAAIVLHAIDVAVGPAARVVDAPTLARGIMGGAVVAMEDHEVPGSAALWLADALLAACGDHDAATVVLAMVAQRTQEAGAAWSAGVLVGRRDAPTVGASGPVATQVSTVAPPTAPRARDVATRAWGVAPSVLGGAGINAATRCQINTGYDHRAGDGPLECDGCWGTPADAVPMHDYEVTS